jgi:toxin ParE1/3/4
MSARRLVQRPQARRDILGIVARITRHNPTAARALYDAYERGLVTLRDHPEAGRRYAPDHAALGAVRAVPVPGYTNYLIFSRYDGDTIEVTRVLHGARDILAVLDSDG